MKKRTSVYELLDDQSIGAHLRNLCEKNELLISQQFSEKLVRTLQLLANQNELASSLSYLQIQDLAREAGISNNLSKTTIKQAREILSISSRKRDQSRNDMAYYVIKNRLAGLFLVNEQGSVNTVKVHAVIADLLIPIVLLKAQQQKTPVRSFQRVAPYAAKIMSCSNAGCELFMSLLEYPDEDMNHNRMRNYAFSTTSTHLSYATLQKIEKTAQWALDSFKISDSVVEEVVDLAISMEPTIHRLKKFKIENLGEVVSKMLFASLEAAILSKSVSQERLYSHF